MDHERLRVADVREMAPDAERLDEPARLVAAALEIDREDRAGPARQVALRELVERRRRQSRVADASDAVLPLEPLGDRLRVRDVFLHPQRERLEPLQEQERVERAETRAEVADRLRP